MVYGADHLDQADHLVNVYLPLACDVRLPDHMNQCYTIRSQIAFVHADPETAFQSLAELQHLGGQRRLPRVVAAAKLKRSVCCYCRAKDWPQGTSCCAPMTERSGHANAKNDSSRTTLSTSS